MQLLVMARRGLSMDRGRCPSRIALGWNGLWAQKSALPGRVAVKRKDNLSNFSGLKIRRQKEKAAEYDGDRDP